MNNKTEIILDENIGSTKIHSVFNKDNYLPDQLFAYKDRQYSILFMDDYLFSSANDISQNRVNKFLCEVSFQVYITASVFQGYSSYSSIRFNSVMNFDELQTELGEPLGSQVGTNWTDDYLYDESSKWGIYHLHDAFCLIVGYDKSLQQIVNKTLLKDLPVIRPASFFFELVTQYMNDEEKQKFIQESIKNNPWLKEVKVYSLPESDE